MKLNTKKTEGEIELNYAGFKTINLCMKDIYELNKDHWYYQVKEHWFFPYKKVRLPEWWEYWCPKHKRGHKKPIYLFLKINCLLISKALLL